MVKRTIGSGLFLLGLMGLLGTAASTPHNQPADPTDRVVDQLTSHGFFMLVMAAGLFLRRGGAPKPVLAPRRRDRDGQEPRRVRAASVPVERRSRKDDWEPLGSDPEPGGRDTGSCAKCGYRPVAYDAEYCPSCAARNPNPGVVSRVVGRAVWLGGLAGGLFGATGGYFALASGGVGGAIGGLLLGTLAGMMVGLLGGILGGGVARLSGAR